MVGILIKKWIDPKVSKKKKKARIREVFSQSNCATFFCF